MGQSSAPARGTGRASIDDEELRAYGSRGAVRISAVGDLIAVTGAHGERPPVGQLRVQAPLNAVDDVSLFAPVIGGVARLVLDESHAHLAELPRAPDGLAGRASMLGRLDARPVGHAEGNARKLHGCLSSSYDWRASFMQRSRRGVS